MSNEKKSEPEVKVEIDWENIAMALAQKVMFAVTHLKCPGSGTMVTLNSSGQAMRTKHWKEDFADALEKIPGGVLDREVMHAYDLPAKERRKFFAKRKAEAAAAAAAEKESEEEE